MTTVDIPQPVTVKEKAAVGAPKVAVVKTSPEKIFDDIAEVMVLADVEKHLPKDIPVILKDNISWHMPFLSANTTPWQLEGVIRCLKDLGYKKIVCVQNNTVVTDPYKGERLNKYVPIFKKYDIEVLYNFKKSDMSWIKYQPEGKLHVLDQIFPEGFTIPDYFVGKSILHLPTVKCHIYTGMTGAMKNAFGGLLNKKRHYTHSVIHETLVDLLMVQREIHSGIFTVMDGTICGDGAGPRTMTPVVKNYMLASADSVAIDATSAKMMGLEPLGVKCIRMAHEEGLGVGDPAQIQYEGVDISDVNFGFAQTDNAVSKVGKLIWFGPFKHLQWFLFHTPLLYAFVFGSFFYHDYIWWPIEGKRRMREVAKTEWGKLFDAYPE